jgi:WD40 repeat protein
MSKLSGAWDGAVSIGVVLVAAVLALTFGSSLAGAAPGDPPEVTPPTVLEVTTTGVRVEATINPNAAETNVRFEWRAVGDPEFEQDFNPEPSTVDGIDPVTVEAQLGEGLEPGTDYEVRTRAFSDNGETFSTAVTFTTAPAAAPTVNDPVVTDVTNDAATFTGEVHPQGSPTTYRFEYRRSVDVDWISIPDGDEEVGNGDDPFDENDLHEVTQTVTGLDSETEYVVRLVATNDHGSATSGEETFETGAPVLPTSSIPNLTDVTQTGARFIAKLDPNGEDGGSWHFEYRRLGDPSWISAPIPDETFTGDSPVVVAHQVEGLTPATSYEVRLVGTSVGGTAPGPSRTFTTRSTAVSSPVQRAFEQVTPPDKEGTDLPPDVGYTSASASGDRFVLGIVFQGAFAGSPTTDAAYLMNRTSTKWETKPIAPGPKASDFFMFNRDLSGALLSDIDPPALDPAQSPGVPHLFRRDNIGDTYELLTLDPATFVGSGNNTDPAFSWASSDLRHVVFSTRSGTLYEPGAPQNAVYYANGDDLSIASIQPGGSTPFPDAGAGAGLVSAGAGNFRTVSEDGSRIFFTAPQTTDPEPSGGAQLYVRKDHGEPGAETVHVSVPEPSVSDPNGTQSAFFRGASTDGSRVFFTSPEKLTTDSTADSGNGRSDLYLFDVDANAGAGDLIDLTTSDPDGADVLGVVGMSEDGARVYFVATGDLAGAATDGEPNLYLWEAGQGITYITTLDPSDGGPSGVWGDPKFTRKESRVTPDGRHVAFASKRQLTAYDNAGTSQVYVYHSDRPAQIECASCDPTADGDIADATISDQTLDQPNFSTNNPSAAMEKRNITDDGRRVFFETSEALEGADTNGKVDVYEFDSAAGRVTLVSRGRNLSPRAHFAGASADGSDVFLWTRERLVGWDHDSLTDIYDARAGGGLPEPDPPKPPCGLDCQGSPGGRPELPDPGSPTLVGPDDPSPGPTPEVSARRLSRAQLAKLARGRKVAIRARVNRGGRVSLRARAKIGKRSRTVATDSVLARRAGSVTLDLKLSKAALRRLFRTGALRLAVSIRFANALEAHTMTITLRRTRKTASRSLR